MTKPKKVHLASFQVTSRPLLEPDKKRHMVMHPLCQVNSTRTNMTRDVTLVTCRACIRKGMPKNETV